MKINNQKYLLALLLLLTSACATTGPKQAKTQLEIREAQTRTFETNDQKRVLKAMLNVLQDEGYVVKNANTELGFLSATIEKDIESQWPRVLLPNEVRWKKASITECTANVSDFGPQTRVRVTFQEKILDNFGDIVKVRQVTAPQYYQDFFAKVSKGVFLEQEGI